MDVLAHFTIISCLPPKSCRLTRHSTHRYVARTSISSLKHKLDSFAGYATEKV